MQGLSYTKAVVLDGETPNECGTPVSNFDDIPIDPALGGPARVPSHVSVEQSIFAVDVSYINDI